MTVGNLLVEEFGGVAKNAHPTKLALGLWQTDENGDHFQEGSWRVRRGLRHTNLASAGAQIDAFQGAEIPDGRFSFVRVYGETIQGFIGVLEQGATLAAEFTDATFLTSGKRRQIVEYGRRLYINEGWRNPLRWDGLTALPELVGIAAPDAGWTEGPTATAAGGMANGVHLLRYRYKDSRTGYVSDPTEARSVTVSSGNGELDFAVDGATEILLSSDAKADRIVIEATLTGGFDPFYVAAEILNDASVTTVTLDRTDNELISFALPWPSTGHGVPVPSANLVSFRERLWWFGTIEHSTGDCDVTQTSNLVNPGTTTPDWTADALGSASGGSPQSWQFERVGDARSYQIDFLNGADLQLTETYAGVTGTDVSYRIYSPTNNLWVSQAGFPESVRPFTFINGPNGEGAGELTAGLGYHSVMIFFTARSMFKFSWTLDPTVDGEWTQLDTIRGALNNHVVIEVQGRVYALDTIGFHVWAGGMSSTDLSDPIDQLIRDNVDFDQADRFSVLWIPELGAIRWFVTYSGDTVPRNYFAYYPSSNTWATGSYRQEISEANLVPTSQGLLPLLGDDNGQVWISNLGTCDGCVAADSHLKANGTATVVDVTPMTLDTTNEGLAGAFAYHPATDVYAEIASNTASQLTLVSPGFNVRPPVNDEAVWVGGIDAVLKTRAFVAPKGALRFLHQPTYFRIYFDPLIVTRTMRVRGFANYSSDFTEWDDASESNQLQRNTYHWANALANGRMIEDEVQVIVGDTAVSGNEHEIDGVAEIGWGGKFRRVFEFELQIDEPDVPLELLGVELESQGLEAQK